jgi:hypothetical protein
VAEQPALYGVPQERRKTSLIAAPATPRSAVAERNEKVWRVWQWAAGRMFAAAAILTVVPTTAKRVALRKAAFKHNERCATISDARLSVHVCTVVWPITLEHKDLDISDASGRISRFSGGAGTRGRNDCGVHARLRRRNLLILLRIRQLSQPPHLLIFDGFYNFVTF